MSDTSLMETLAWVPDIDKSDIPPPLESMAVDSMSPPHTTEHTSSRHALARDCAVLRRIDADMDECRARIARAQAQMRLLARQRHVVQHRVSIHRARLSPLRNVPDQVLQEIFQHCLPDTPFVVPNARSAPLLLTHVCRRWRVVAQCTSELWSSLALHDRGVWNYELEVEMVKRWLDRSHARPIRMSIACSPCTDFGTRAANALHSDLFQIVVAHSARLSALRLSVNRTYLNHFMSRARPVALRSIAISLHSGQRTDELPAGPTPSAAAAPHLRHVSLDGDGTSISVVPHALLAQITHLVLDYRHALDLALLFRDLPRLECLALTLRFRSLLPLPSLPPSLPAAPGDHHRVVVVGPSSLRRLEIRLDGDTLEFGDPTTALGTVLDQLELPALRVFVLAVTEADSRTKTDHVTCHEQRDQWVGSPSVRALLSRSRHANARPQLACWDPSCP